MIDHYELRDHVDDIPYRTTYDTWRQAFDAACRKADKLGYPVQIWSIGSHGERYEGSSA